MLLARSAGRMCTRSLASSHGEGFFERKCASRLLHPDRQACTALTGLASIPLGSADSVLSLQGLCLKHEPFRFSFNVPFITAREMVTHTAGTSADDPVYSR